MEEFRTLPFTPVNKILVGNFPAVSYGGSFSQSFNIRRSGIAYDAPAGPLTPVGQGCGAGDIWGLSGIER